MSKKLVSVLAISVLKIETNKEDEVIQKKVLRIHYLLHFQKNTIKIKTLLDFGSKVTAMILTYALKLGFKVLHINVGT